MTYFDGREKLYRRTRYPKAVDKTLLKTSRGSVLGKVAMCSPLPSALYVYLVVKIRQHLTDQLLVTTGTFILLTRTGYCSYTNKTQFRWRVTTSI